MKAYVIEPVVGYPETGHRLFLHAETPADNRWLEMVVENYHTVIAGKDGTDEWQHVGIELKPKESE